ncbi:MAG: hypothetical protein SD837_14735 [Candidatus Electrothrix scaldis]|nr:MAG: hypothetical protein SD837_14735 [Candidatus Electrothrix sp. GW3-3]
MARCAPRHAGKVVALVSSLCLFFIILGQISFATGADIRKFCAPETRPPQSFQVFLASNITSQQTALQRNATLQEGRLLFSAKEGDALFYPSQLAPGDCVLVNPQEVMRLAAEEVTPTSGSSRAHEQAQRTSFFPVVLFVQRNKSKQYGLIAEKVLRQLQPVRKEREATTKVVVNAKTDPDLFLIYVFCPADRSGPCDLTAKRNGKWLLDKKSGEQFHMSVLARSIRGGSRSTISRRLQINHDTPQGIYTIWGAVSGGGDSPWFQTARIDLDAAMPPINVQPYPINSFLLSRIVPESALDDYWINEWPLAYTLGRIALRIAPGDFEAKQSTSHLQASGTSPLHPTHGCINTGNQQEQLLQILLEAGVFHKDDFILQPGTTGKRWSVAAKLGKAFVILKDRDEPDTVNVKVRK